MNGLLVLFSFLFLLQSVTNIVLIVFIKKLIISVKHSKININNIFGGFSHEHFQSKNGETLS